MSSPSTDHNRDEMYRLLVEQASDGIAVYDHQGRILEVNSRACEIVGRTRDEALRMRVEDVIAPEDLAGTPLRYEDLRSGKSLLGERVLLRPDGTRVPVELSARMLSNGTIQVIIRDITERKRYDDDIRRSRDFYLTLLEDFPTLVWRANTTGACDYFNRTWLAFTGRTLEQELGDGWTAGIHPDDVEPSERIYLSAFKERSPFVMEYRLRRYDGEYRWISDHGTPFYGPDGEFLGYLGTCYDVTDHRRAEDEVRRLNAELEQRVADRTAALEQANHYLQAEIAERKRAEARIRFHARMLDQIETAVIATDLEGKITYWNNYAERLYGYPAEEALGRPVVDVVVIAGAAGDAEQIMQMVFTDGHWAGEYTCRRKDGSLVPVYVIDSLIHDDEGRPVAITGASVDITDRRKAEEEYARLLLEVEFQRRRLDNIVRNVPGVVWEAWGVPDKESQHVDYINSYVETMLGYTVDEWLATPNFWLKIVHPDDRERAAAIAAEHFSSGLGGTNTFRWVAKDGRVLWVEAQDTIILDEDGKPVGMRGVTMDISERMRVEEESARLLASEQSARLEAESAVRTRDELLAIVSHDLKNPLAAIKGNSQLMRRRLSKIVPHDEIERLESVLARIDEAAGKMSMLINDLMDFGRLQAGQSLTLQRLPVDLVALVRGAVAAFRPTAPSHRIAFDPAVPSLVGMWDNTRLEQVLSNLLSNAVKYSPGGGTISVRVAREETPAGSGGDVDGAVDGEGAGGTPQRWGVISVSDEGIGIAPEDLPHIFEWFRRARDISGHISGAGIGLASVSYIVEQHGGTITVDSVPGHGSTFTIRLPQLDRPARPTRPHLSITE